MSQEFINLVQPKFLSQQKGQSKLNSSYIKIIQLFYSLGFPKMYSNLTEDQKKYVCTIVSPEAIDIIKEMYELYISHINKEKKISFSINKKNKEEEVPSSNFDEIADIEKKTQDEENNSLYSEINFYNEEEKNKEMYNGDTIEVENGKNKNNMNNIYNENELNLNTTVINTEQLEENLTEDKKRPNYEKYFIPNIEEIKNKIKDTDEQKIKAEKEFLEKIRFILSEENDKIDSITISQEILNDLNDQKIKKYFEDFFVDLSKNEKNETYSFTQILVYLFRLNMAIKIMFIKYLDYNASKAKINQLYKENNLIFLYYKILRNDNREAKNLSILENINSDCIFDEKMKEKIIKHIESLTPNEIYILLTSTTFLNFDDLIKNKNNIFLKIRNLIKSYFDQFFSFYSYKIKDNYADIVYWLKNTFYDYSSSYYQMKKYIKEILEYYIPEIFVYGSFSTYTEIEGSDIDILIYCDTKGEDENVFFKRFHFLLKYQLIQENLKLLKCEFIEAKVNIIKIKFLINLRTIKFDLSFTNKKEIFEEKKILVQTMNKEIDKYRQIRPCLMYIKQFCQLYDLNKTYTGGISSSCNLSLCFHLIKSEEYPNIEKLSLAQFLLLFFENYGNFDYFNYIVGTNEKIKIKDAKMLKNRIIRIKDVFIEDNILKAGISKNGQKVSEIKKLFLYGLKNIKKNYIDFINLKKKIFLDFNIV